MEASLRFGKKIIPRALFKKIQPHYHLLMSFLGAVFYRFPSREINVVGITGTKGKTSTVEIINAILEEAGYKTALASTLRFKIGEDSKRNMYKMTMPGRFFIQKFLREAVNSKCSFAIIEITSEAQVQHRNRHVYLDSLIFTNISPEHIESHGSYEKYLEAKLNIARSLERSKKKRATLIINRDDKEAKKFLSLNVQEKYTYSIGDATPWKTSDNGGELTFRNTLMKIKLPGTFNIYNILAGATYAETQKIPHITIKDAVEKIDMILGRVEKIRLEPAHPLFDKQDFTVVVDYAHTPDSLEQFYQVFSSRQSAGQAQKLICVLGNTGGGRDTWKRKEMAKIAEQHCDSIILTNEDPYDDDPMSIVNEMKKAITKKTVKIIIDRREAIRQAIDEAHSGDAVLITGKGTDPYIMEANGKKTPWSDAEVAREEIEKSLNQKNNARNYEDFDLNEGYLKQTRPS